MGAMPESEYFGRPGVHRDGALARLFDGRVATAECWGELETFDLHAEEAAALAAAAERRRRDFFTGRTCARAALTALGWRDYPLLPRSDRAPAWPQGVVGSITHTQGYCGVAAAADASILSLGVDAERIERVDRKIWPRILTDDEAGRLQDLPEQEGQLRAAILFSVKEAYFKCQHPLTGLWLNFTDVGVELDGSELRVFPMAPTADLAPALRSVAGRWVMAHGLVVTAVLTPA